MPVPPGPRGLPGVGVLPHLATDAPTWCTRWTERYGPVLRLPVLRSHVYALSDPAHVEQVLVTANRNHHKGAMFRRTDFLFGRGLVLDDGPSWQQQRRLLSPVLSAAAVAEMRPLVEEVVADRLDRWSGRLDTEAEMMRLTLAVAVRALLGVRLDEARLGALTRAFGTVLEHLGPRMATFSAPAWVPVPGERRARQALAVVDGFAAEVLAGPRETPFLAALDDDRARDQVVTMLFGGYEATAHALSWALFELAHDPALAARVRDDASGRLATQVALEALRLYPSFWMVLRSSYEPQVVGGYDVPGGAAIMALPFVTQRSASVWDSPMSFCPGRFAEGGEAERLPKHAHYAFGGGQRACIGRSLAETEMAVVLGEAVRRFDLAPVDAKPVRHRARSTLRSRTGLPLLLTPR